MLQFKQLVQKIIPELFSSIKMFCAEFVPNIFFGCYTTVDVFEALSISPVLRAGVSILATLLCFYLGNYVCYCCTNTAASKVIREHVN